MSLATPPLSLYVHFPWCVRKCPYCDFNSHPLQGELPESSYIARLLDDLAADVEWMGVRPLQTIFLGGGTPSLVSSEAIAALLEGIARILPASAIREVTLEANPGAVDRARFRGYREAGVTRISIGAQSFNAEHLHVLGRIHSPDDTLRAVDAARAAGFDGMNLDLMHGLPHQRVEDAMADIERALALEPSHLSWYQLTLEPKTEFGARPPPLPDEDTLADIEERGLSRLREAGFHRYEVSAFARPGAEARHNLNYWQFGDYLGIGAGAHGKVTFTGSNEIVRTAKPAQPRRYLMGSASALRCSAPVAADARPGEFLLNALRLVDGVPEDLFRQRTGVDLEHIRVPRDRMTALGLLRADRLGVTPLGLRHLDTVVGAFL